MIMVEKGKEGAGKEKNGSGSYKNSTGAPHWVHLSVIPPTKPPRRFRQLSQPDNVDSSCSPSCSYRRRTPRGSTPRGEAQKNEALDLQGLRSGGDSWTRTNDPFDVNEVLYRLSHATMLSYFWPTSPVGHLEQFVLPTEPTDHVSVCSS